MSLKTKALMKAQLAQANLLLLAKAMTAGPSPSPRATTPTPTLMSWKHRKKERDFLRQLHTELNSSTVID